MKSANVMNNVAKLDISEFAKKLDLLEFKQCSKISKCSKKT